MKLCSFSVVDKGGKPLTERFDEVWAALEARDHSEPSDKAEFLRGAAAAFAACFRGDESEWCLAEAQTLHDPPSD